MGGQTEIKQIPCFTAADKQTLVTIVKTSQKCQSKGSKGGWKEFLTATDKKYGTTRSDPVKRPWETLASFVQTFIAEEDIKMVKHIKDWDTQLKKIELLESQGIWGKSPEQKLVQTTHRHSRYKGLYSFPAYNEGWVMTKLGKANDTAVLERMISLDCEMVLCERGEREVVRVCAVDRDCKTLLDLLVKPTMPIVDYLTYVTGVSAADLKDVTCSPVDAQKEVLKLLTPGTILVGHSLYHDLTALKIKHARVVDTALIFEYCNKPKSYSVGLNDLCKAVLGHGFREDGKPHDCLEDAMIPMQIVLHKLKHNLNEPLDIPLQMLDEDQLSKLYLHSIPSSISSDDLQDVFPKQHSCEIQAISWKKHETGKTYAIFRSSSEANRAFEKLQGQLEMDSNGRPQKVVAIHVLSSFGKMEELSFKVRKMSPDNINGDGSETRDYALSHAMKKRRRENDDEDPSKDTVDDNVADQETYTATESTTARKRTRKRISEADLPDWKDNVKFNERIQELEEKLMERDAEIESLQRIIVALTRRQGL